MNKEEMLIEFSTILDKKNILKVAGIHEENYKPHQFTVGDEHVKEANNTNAGVITEEICEMYQCVFKDCELSYEKHDSDKQLVLQLTRHATPREANDELLKIKRKLEDLGIRTVAFADSEEGYEFVDL